MTFFGRNIIFMVYNNILEAIGGTPLIKLNRITDSQSADIYVKYEGLNVGGSVKTRTAYNMILQAEKDGLINKNTIIVEPTSGNQGIGLALVAAVRGYRAKIIMPDSVSEERRKLVHHYGAEVILVHDAGNIGKAIEECVAIAEKLKKEDPNVFVPQQFENSANPEAHLKHTGIEILNDIGRKIDGFCSGIGTGGTISGIGKVLKNANLSVVTVTRNVIATILSFVVGIVLFNESLVAWKIVGAVIIIFGVTMLNLVDKTSSKGIKFLHFVLKYSFKHRKIRGIIKKKTG